MEEVCAKNPTRYFLILLIFPSLIFSSISMTFTVIESPTSIFFLSRFAFFLLLEIFPTGKLLVDLGGVISNFGSDSRVFCQTVLFNSNKKQKPKKIARSLRTNNSSLRESYYAIPCYPYAMIYQIQSHLFKIKNVLTCIYI